LSGERKSKRWPGASASAAWCRRTWPPSRILRDVAREQCDVCRIWLEGDHAPAAPQNQARDQAVPTDVGPDIDEGVDVAQDLAHNLRLEGLLHAMPRNPARDDSVTCGVHAHFERRQLGQHDIQH
jgi:hypothetical protein